MSTKKLIDFYQIFWNFPKKYETQLGKIGDILQYVTPIVVLVYALGLTLYNWLHGVIYPYRLFEVFAITYAVTTIIQVTLKFLFDNPRPRDEIADNNNEGVNPDLNFDPGLKKHNSFPSGHTMSAMTGGMFWFEMTFGIPSLGIFFGIVGFSLGILTAFSRIVKHAHWVRDVGFSAIVSIVAYFIACQFL